MAFLPFQLTSGLVSPFRPAGAPPTPTATISHGEFRGATASELRERANLPIRKTTKDGHSLNLTRGQVPEHTRSQQPRTTAGAEAMSAALLLV